MDKKDIFKPRDFIYLNKEKLNSYFSQLFGGLIQSIDTSNQKGKELDIGGGINAEALAKFGLGESSSNLIGMIIKQFGDLNASIKGDLSGELNRIKTNSTQTQITKTLEHFQYTLFEQSLVDLNYLIDMEKILNSTENYIDAGTLREKLKPTDFVKFKASRIQISDYRNVSDFIKIIKRVIDLFTQAKSGEIKDNFNEENGVDGEVTKEYIKAKSLSSIANMFSNNNNMGMYSKAKIVEVIVNALTEIFDGDLIPLEVLLTSEFSLNKRGILKFESQLKDDFLLEKRTDLSFKYSYFEDANWTIIGQITSLKGARENSIEEALDAMKNRIDEAFKEPKNIDINVFVKTIVREIDLLTKTIGLQPQVDQKSIALTPIAIYREPQINQDLVNVR